MSGGHFFSPWENPSYSERSPEDCERNAKWVTELRMKRVGDVIEVSTSKEVNRVAGFFNRLLPMVYAAD